MASLLASRCRVNLSARNFSSSQPSEGYIQMFTDKGSRSEPTSGTLRLLTVINEYLANLAVEVSLLSNLTTMRLLCEYRMARQQLQSSIMRDMLTSDRWGCFFLAYATGLRLVKNCLRVHRSIEKRVGRRQYRSAAMQAVMG